MLRWLFVAATAAAVLLIDTPLALAADDEVTWPSLPFIRGHGAYLSPWKVLGGWFIFLVWVRTTDWINTDAQQNKLKYGTWNPIAFFSFFVALLLFWLLPSFIGGAVLMGIAWLVPLTVYIRYRNAAVQQHEKVLTPEHLRSWTARSLAVIGIKISGAEIDPRDLGPDVKLKPMGGADDRTDNANRLLARQSIGWTPSRELIHDSLSQRATHIMLDYTAESVSVRYQIDGAWLDRAPMEREIGDAVLEVYKGLSALNIKERRRRQSGVFGLDVGKNSMTCSITSQGTKTGERALLQFVSRKSEFHSLDEIGMREKTQERIDTLLDQNGVIVFSSLPSGGLSTTMELVITHADRFVRSFVKIQDEALAEHEVENVPVTTYSSAGGESPLTVLPKIIRTYPDVIIVPEVPDLETINMLAAQVDMDRLVMISVRAREAVEALLRVLMLKIPPSEFASVVTGVLNTRLIRKLCDQCKEAYPPPPQVLKQLGLPQGRIEHLYRPPTEPINPKKPDEVCDQCNGVGYYGRTGIFELLVIDDNLRQVLATTPKLDALRQAARKAKHRSLQDEGVLLVARGVTSIQELARVLKQ